MDWCFSAISLLFNQRNTKETAIKHQRNSKQGPSQAQSRPKERAKKHQRQIEETPTK